jgi:hypothetical protein
MRKMTASTTLTAVRMSLLTALHGVAEGLAGIQGAGLSYFDT